MPKLLLFAPCEKVIIAQEGNTVSLITILQELTVSIPPDVQIPADAKVPMQWYGFSLWQKQPGDEGKRYEQQIELTGPDGGIVVSASSQFEMTAPAHRILSIFPGFPVGQFGEYMLRLYLREEKESEEKKEVASFPLTVKRSTAG